MRPPTQFCIVRHGETAWNSERRIQGQIDIPLNATGLAQAQAAGRWLASGSIRESFGPIRALYGSDLQRAWKTALCIAEALQLTPVAVPALRERRYGLFEGLTYADAEQQYPETYAAFERRDPDFAFPEGGESLAQFHTRVTGKLQALADLHRGETIVIVAHGGVLDIINRFVRGNPLDTPRDFLVPNAGMNWLHQDDDDLWHIDCWGDTRHLATGALDELKLG